MKRTLVIGATLVLVLAGCKVDTPSTPKPEDPPATATNSFDNFRVVTVTLDKDGSKVTCVVWQNTQGYEYGGISCDWDRQGIR